MDAAIPIIGSIRVQEPAKPYILQNKPGYFGRGESLIHGCFGALGWEVLKTDDSTSLCCLALYRRSSEERKIWTVCGMILSCVVHFDHLAPVQAVDPKKS